MASLPHRIGDVSFRRFAGVEDYSGIAEVLNESAHHDGIERHDSTEEIASMYTHLTNCDLDRDLLVAEEQGQVVGYRRVFWYVEEATGARALAAVGLALPRVRPLGITDALVEWGEQRLGEIALEAPHEGVEFFISWADEGEQDTLTRLAAAGYRVAETYAEMVRPLDLPIEDHELPSGLEIRPVTESDRRRVWDADQEAFRDHVGFSEGTEEDFREFVDRPHFDPALWKVAFDGDAIAGQVLNYHRPHEDEALGRKRGWTEWISTQRAWRGKGVAKALITESMRMFKAIGMTEAVLGVHTTNPTGAYQLYESLGYRVTSRSFELRKPFDA